MAAFSSVLAIPPLMSPDSGGYLNWEPIRTPGYPAFLWAIGWLSPSFAALPYVQMGSLVAGAAFLAQAGARLGSAWWIWTLMGLGIVGNPRLWQLAWQMQTEAMFVTLTMVFMGCIAMALALRPKGQRWLIIASLALGATILVRPVGYALLGVAPLVGLLWRGHRRTAVAAATLPAIAILLAISTWNWVHKGYFGTQIFGGTNIVGQVALLVRPDTEFRDPATEVAAGLTHIREHLPWDMQSWRLYYWMTTFAYNPALYDYALPAIRDAVQQSFRQFSSPIERAKQENALGWAVALGTIRQSPYGYIHHVAVHFVSLWMLPTISSQSEAALLRATFCDEAFKGFYCSGQVNAIKLELSESILKTKDTLMLMAMLASFVLIVVVALWPAAPLPLTFSAVAALCVHANHLLVALVEAGLFRYALSMWPALLVMMAGTAAWMLSTAKDYFERRSRLASA